MTDDEELEFEDTGEDELEDGGAWDGGSFLSGMLVGAAVGAVLALAFAPRSGAETRRLVRRRAAALAEEAGDRLHEARDEAREALRDKKEALRRRLAKGLERLGDEIGT